MMELQVIPYNDLDRGNSQAMSILTKALLQHGIVGIRDAPSFQEKTRAYIKAARQFCALHESVKRQYTPRRDQRDNEGYELGAEWFKDASGKWQIDDKKASYYAFVPDRAQNKWPREVDLKTPYLELGELIFNIGKQVLQLVGLNETIGLPAESIVGYGRMLHYHKEGDSTAANPQWCGAHFDHGVFTGLIPAYYFKAEQEIDEPEEAGLYIKPTQGQDFEKIQANDKSILLFQVGEFGQLASHDQIRATQHLVKKAQGDIERYSFALFYNASPETIIHPISELKRDARYLEKCFPDGSIQYQRWDEASLDRYRASVLMT